MISRRLWRQYLSESGLELIVGLVKWTNQAVEGYYHNRPRVGLDTLLAAPVSADLQAKTMLSGRGVGRPMVRTLRSDGGIVNRGAV